MGPKVSQMGSKMVQNYPLGTSLTPPGSHVQSLVNLLQNRDPPEGPLGGQLASSGVQKHPRKHTENQPGFRHVFLMILGAKKGPEITQKQTKKQARIEMMISLILLTGTMK